MAALVEDGMNPLSGVSALRRSRPDGLFLELDSEVSHRDINGRSAQGHASEHALDSRSHCSLRVGRTCGKYDDVAGACTSALQSFLELLSAGSKGSDMADTRRLISKKGGQLVFASRPNFNTHWVPEGPVD